MATGHREPGPAAVCAAPESPHRRPRVTGPRCRRIIGRRLSAAAASRGRDVGLASLSHGRREPRDCHGQARTRTSEVQVRAPAAAAAARGSGSSCSLPPYAGRLLVEVPAPAVAPESYFYAGLILLMTVIGPSRWARPSPHDPAWAAPAAAGPRRSVTVDEN